VSTLEEEVALILMRYIVRQYGIEYCKVTDQRTKFMGDVFKRLCKLLKAHKLNTNIYHPESNGVLQRMHKVMVECFVVLQS
jgi:hypothetical protein